MDEPNGFTTFYQSLMLNDPDPYNSLLRSMVFLTCVGMFIVSSTFSEHCLLFTGWSFLMDICFSHRVQSWSTKNVVAIDCPAVCAIFSAKYNYKFFVLSTVYDLSYTIVKLW